MKPFYRFAITVVGSLARLFLGLKAYNLDIIPPRGGFILASNHIALVDPPFIGVSLKREIYFMAKKELFRSWWFGGMIARLNAFPVNRRGIDRASLENARKILDRGEPLLIFPEGTRGTEAGFLPPRPGVGLLARSCGVPVIPMYIHGSNHLKKCFFRREKLAVIIGEPIDTKAISVFNNDKSGYRKLAEEIMSRIGKIRDTHLAEIDRADKRRA